MCSNHELQATLNALGYLEDDVYYKSKDCLNCLKDMVRYLRRDDPNEKTIRLELLKTDVISNDFIPLLKGLKLNKKGDAELFDLTLRLIVNLTQSAINCFEQKIPEEKLQYNTFLEIDNFLQKAKQPCTDEKFIRIICDKLKEIVSKNWEDRAEEEDMIAERILFLLRNILHIKPSDDDTANRLETDINAQDMLILSLHNAGLFNTINEIATSSNFMKFSSHILEIIVLTLHGQSPEELAKVSDKEMINLKSKRSVVEKSRDSDELAKLLNKDKQSKKVNNKLRMNSRHSRFMGTYVATNMKSINDDNDLIVHKQARNMGDLLNDESKQSVKKSKNKLALEQEDNIEHRSVLFIRIILKNFCTQFMKDSYNIFLRNLRDMINRKKFEDEEVCFYYWLIQFLTEFNRNTDIDEQKKIEQIRETFSLEIFHSVEIYIQRCIEMMQMEKKQSRIWSKRMHTCLKCYKENLVTLFVLEKKIIAFNEANDIKPHNKSNNNTPTKKSTGDEETDLVALAEDMMEEGGENGERSKTSNFEVETPIEVKSLLDERATALLTKLKNQIFYIQEFRDLFIKLLKDFDSNKTSKAFLRDLIEANHIFILLLEYHTKKNGVLSVMSKKKKKKSKKAKDKKVKKGKETKEDKEKRLADQKMYKKRLEQQKTDFKEYSWQTQFSKIGALLQNEDELKCVEEDLMPAGFGMATNDEEFDAQKNDIIEKIQTLLSANKPDDSITLFREARSLWPMDKELFGSDQIAADEEFEVFKELYMKPLEIKKPVVNEEKKVPDEDEEGGEADKNKKKNGDDDEGIEDDLYNNEELDEFNGVNVEEESDTEIVEQVEENLDLEKFLFRYTHPHVLKCFILMLGEYAKNSDFLNRCCMNMFERIAYECHSTPCLYQLSLFNLINIIYKDPMSRCCMDILGATSTQKKNSIDDIWASAYSAEDMFAFFRQLLAKFFEQTKNNDKLFIEVLFFKEKKILFSLGEDGGGYEAIANEEKQKEKKRCAWTQEDQDELKEFYEKFTNDDDNTEKNPAEGDIIDKLMLNINQDRKRREICNQLVNIGCARSIDDFKDSTNKLGRNKLWRPEDFNDLKQCFELVKENATQSNRQLSEMMGQLQENLSIKRSKNAVASKLVELDLIKEVTEILGSASSKKIKSKKDFLQNNMDDFVESSDDSGDEISEQKRAEIKKAKEERRKKKKAKKAKRKARKEKNKEGESEKGPNSDLFDAESGSSSNSSGSSSDSDISSDNESSNENSTSNKLLSKNKDISKTKRSSLMSDSDNNSNDGEEDAENPTNKLQLGSSSEDGEDNSVKSSEKKEKSTKKKNKTLIQSESDSENEKESSNIEVKKKSSIFKEKKKVKVPQKDGKKEKKKRKNAENVLSLILSDDDNENNEEEEDSDKDNDLISDLLSAAKKSPPGPKPKSRNTKHLIPTSDSNNSDEEDEDKAKENLIIKPQEKDKEIPFHELEDEDNNMKLDTSFSPVKSKKRKKKFKPIIDDSSNSNDVDMNSLTKEKPVLTVLGEISNSENSQNIKLNKDHTRVTSIETTNTVNTGNDLNSTDIDDSDSDDDDMPLSMKIQLPKRQRLILSDGDDD